MLVWKSSQDVQQVWASFGELSSFRGISVSRTLEEAATSNPAKRFREYLKLKTISFEDFCPMESTVEVH
jgi:hypothetical protein